MSQPVELADVQRRVREFGECASVITVNGDNSPHVVSALVSFRDDLLCVRVGGRTHKNVVANPRVTLTWQPPAGGEYMLILDGSVVSIDGEPDAVAELAINVASGILHGMAGPAAAGGVCLAL